MFLVALEEVIPASAVVGNNVYKREYQYLTSFKYWSWRILTTERSIRSRNATNDNPVVARVSTSVDLRAEKRELVVGRTAARVKSEAYSTLYFNFVSHGCRFGIWEDFIHLPCY
jgi:hypothetical protein